MTTREGQGLPRAVPLVLVLAFLDMMAMGIVMPVLPILIEELTGSTRNAALWTGVVASIWAVMQFVCAPAIGALSDRFGRRPAILLSTAGLAASWAVMALAPSLAWLIVGRVIGGITSASTSVIFAFMTDLTPAASRTRAFGLVGAALSAGFVAGPALGGALGDIDARLPLWCAAAVSAVTFVFSLLILPESLSQDGRTAFSWRSANPAGALKLLGSVAALRRLAVGNFLLNVAHRLYTSVFVLFVAHRFDMALMEVGLLLAFTSVLDLVIQGSLAGHVARRLGDRRAMAIGLAGGALGLVLMAFAPTREAFIAAMVVNAIWGISEPTMRALMSAQVSAGEQGQLQGAMQCLMSITGIAGPVFFGWVYGLSIDTMPGLAFLIGALGVAVAAILSARDGRDQPVPGMSA